MNETIRLGEIKGVRVGLNWSVIAIFLLLLFGLAAGRFPLRYPDLGVALYVVAGLAAATVFLGSLLAHELAHALVARRNGGKVDGITLWLFGGVARLETESKDPGAEMRMAAVGPFVSLALAAVFGTASWALAAATGDSIAVGVLQWLALINGILAVFNLVPAAPLDGGRILRAFLWRRRGDRFTATITAARAGRAFGWLLVGVGLVELVAAGLAGGLWLALIG